MKKRKHQLFAKYAGSIADKLTTKLSEEEIMEKEQEFERIKSFMENHDIPRLRSILFNQTELNNEAEELYKQIDKAQVHLINARLSNDEQGNKSAISEMETAMCDAMQLLKCFIDRKDKEQKTDNVNHPAHYTWLKDLCGIEVIDITRHMNFCCGNALKYILRAGHKKDASLTDTDKQIEDLNKAIWYLKDEIKRITKLNDKTKV